MEDIDLTLEFKLYRRRYLIVILFGFSQFIISVLLNTLNPIASFLCIIYDQTSLVVNSGGLLFTLMHPIFTFPASYVIDTFGTRTGITVGATLVLIGAGMRGLVNYNFLFVIAGQIIAGIGRPFILNCQAKISANWFTAKSRGKITQILTLILNVSLVIGIVIPGFFFRGYHPVKNGH
jgi:FLVCR family feline leukemia virus subgroup C receptor-related protein